MVVLVCSVVFTRTDSLRVRISGHRPTAADVSPVTYKQRLWVSSHRCARRGSRRRAFGVAGSRENADQSVGKGPEGLVVGGAAGAVVGRRTCVLRGVVERSEHLQEQRIRGCQMSPSRTRGAMSLWVPQ